MGRCPGKILGSSANAGPRLHCAVCKHAGKELAQSLAGSFQIPRNFYSQHGRPLDCKSFFSTEKYFTEFCHNSNTTEVRPLSLSPTGSASDTWNYTECIRKTVSVFWLWFYFSSKLQGWLPVAIGCGKHTLKNISKPFTPYWNSKSLPSNIKMKMSQELT